MSLPSAYQEVEYIQSSGTQYINTGFIPDNKSKLELSMGGWNNLKGIIFWVRSSWSTVASTWRWFLLAWWISQDIWYWWMFWRRYSWSWDNFNVFNFVDWWDYILTLDQSWFYQNWIKKYTPATVTFTSPSSIYLFMDNDNGTANEPSSYKLYYCKIWDNWTLVRDFVPCYRKSDSVIWLYDLVNDTFYTNSWTGTFTKWPDVVIPYKLHWAIQTFHHILTLLSYSDLVAMATNEWNPRTDTLAELNSMKGSYHNSLSWHLTTRTGLSSKQYDTIDGISYYQYWVGTWRIWYMGWYWYRSLFDN